MISIERQQGLLRLEYEHEREEFRRQTELAGIERKVKRGECWYPVSVGPSRYNSLNRLTVEITRSEDTEIEHCFEYGRTVQFFSQDGSGILHYLSFQATVSYAEADRMVVIVPGEDAAAQLSTQERLGVQLAFDETTYRLMFAALNDVASAKGNRLAELRDIVHGASPATFSAMRAPLSLPWLNAAQEAAVAKALAARDFMVIHGPPGTGKTTTLVEAVCEVLRREPQVMVCAQSNTAVDWISLQLERRGAGVLRIGNPSRVTDEMLAFTYERRFESHPDYPLLWQLRRTIRQIRSGKGERENRHQKIARLRERADELELRIRTQLFDSSRVIACTLAGSANPLLTGQHYHTLFIDEAAQALEAACWIAARRCDRIILAGDHCQLPPTVKSLEAQRGGLADTMMETLAERKPECVSLLNVQYRMNRELMNFPSRWFYEGRLQAAPEVESRSLLSLIDEPLVWIDTSRHPAAEAGDDAAKQDYRESFVGATFGRINKAEARLTIGVLEDYATRMGRERLVGENVDFGVISPYRAQVQYLRHLLKKSQTLRPLRKNITINTVDAFQGQERDVVVVSLVRANEKGEIGFLRDLRRMNVAITRARMKLILLGDSTTLCKHRFYRELYAVCKKPELPREQRGEE